MSVSHSFREWASNGAFRKRYGMTPFAFFMGRQPRTNSYSAFSRGDEREVVADQYNLERVQETVMELARPRQELLKEVETNVEASRRKKADTQNESSSSEYTTDDSVMVMRARSKIAKLVGIRTGP